MFDIAINGMGLVGGDSFTFQNIDYSHFNPFNKPEYYHPYCPIDFANDTSCEVVRPCPFPYQMNSSDPYSVRLILYVNKQEDNGSVGSEISMLRWRILTPKIHL